MSVNASNDKPKKPVKEEVSSSTVTSSPPAPAPSNSITVPAHTSDIAQKQAMCKVNNLTNYLIIPLPPSEKPEPDTSPRPWS
jgi:hypothetical protein